MIALFLFYSTIIKSSFSLSHCIEIDNVLKDGLIETFLFDSPSLQCWTDNHKLLLIFSSIFGILFWGMGFPCILTLLMKHKNSISMKKSKLKFDQIISKKARIHSLLYSDLFVEEEKKLQTNNSNNKVNTNQTDIKGKKQSSNLRVSLNSKNSRNKIYYAAFFFKDYKVQYYYWECIIFLQKFTIIFLSNLY